ncbi:ribonuclease E [Kangiella koreensis]|uniref:Ribonuclease E n=1 Tax=Kangiella koreensis (strain DSM 16069 / JCM 12317 / KCTC 12182 / SW-125) TaxID=523791 RepID=C7RBE6_KANKD|nr:ribonuclease E [Kangiella koreensis]ACV26588.1 ribonuclease, Rne/Rng family [Kangiella koreensis DSM 16069]
MRRMLINATNHHEELRVALVDGQRLYDLDIELAGREQKKGNIYKGKVTRIEPSLEAAFVDYGAERHGFLPLKEVAREYMQNAPSRGRPTIKEALKEGQEIIVQIDKEERGNKGAALTTSISLAGSYLVLMPNNPRAGGISRRIEGDERTELKQVMSQLPVPNGMGCIVRTAGIGKSLEEIQYDFNYLIDTWNGIKQVAGTRPAPFLITQESDVITRAIRDYLRPDIGEIIIDRPEIYERVKSELQYQRPDFVSKVKLYRDEIPLFNRYQVESQIESAFQREVRLPSGGSVVFDQTEALLSIDINSARATKGGDIEETALHTNVEAAEEIARQLRLRDIGGLIVIDFIDMGPPRNQREVERVLKDSVARDRARIQIGRISRFGLLEMSRQRLRPSLEESSQHVCPRCTGSGVIRGTDSLALSILRLMEDEAMKESTAEVQAVVPVEVATFLLNEKRRKIEQIEKRQKVRLVVVPNPYLETPHYEVLRVKAGETLEDSSYSLIGDAPEIELVRSSKQPAPVSDQPALKGVKPTSPPPAPSKAVKKKKPGLFARLWTSLFGDDEDKKKKDKQSKNNRGKYDRNTRGRNTRHQGKKRTNQKGRNQTQAQNKNQPQEQRDGKDNKVQQKTGGRPQKKQNDKPQRKQTGPKHEQKPEQKQEQQNVVEQPKTKRPPRKTRAERMAEAKQPQQPEQGQQPAAKQEQQPQQAKKPSVRSAIKGKKAQEDSVEAKPVAKKDKAGTDKPTKGQDQTKTAKERAPKSKAQAEDIMVYKAHKSLERSVSDVMGYSKDKKDEKPEVIKATQQAANDAQVKQAPESASPAKAETSTERHEPQATQTQDESVATKLDAETVEPFVNPEVKSEPKTAASTKTEEPAKEAEQAKEPVAKTEVAKKPAKPHEATHASAPMAKAVNHDSVVSADFAPKPYQFSETDVITTDIKDTSDKHSNSPAAKTSSLN